MRKRSRQQSPAASPRRIQRHPVPWTSEFGLSDGQKDDLICQQASEIGRLQARADSYSGGLERIKGLRSTLKSLMACVDATEERWPIIRITRPMVETLDRLIAKAEGRAQ